MAAQVELFPEPAKAIRADSGRHEPRLWIRRLAIWEKPGELLRNIELRRGLNVLWSPDPGASVAALGRDAGIGHGAGKTLFCRLLRYCLGEETFADEELRDKIVEAFPDGYVGIEAFIDGKPWAILRPFLPMRKHTAREEASLEELMDSGEPGTGVQSLLSTLNGLLPSGIETNMPGQREWKSWLFALAWLSRDQESRLKSILDWRDRDAHSHSPAVGASQEELTIVVRSFLGMVEGEELSVRHDRSRLAEKKQRLEADRSYLRRRMEQQRGVLATSLGLNLETMQQGNLGAAAIHAASVEKLAQLEQRAPPDSASDGLAPLRDCLETILRQRAILEEEIGRTESMLELHREQTKVLRGERANLSAAEIKARLGEICPVCGVPIDHALAEGCGLSHVLVDPDKVAAQLKDVAMQIAACSRAIELWQRQKSEQDTRLTIAKGEENGIRRQITEEEEHRRARERENRRQWFDARNQVEKAAELRAMYDEEIELERDLSKSAAEDETLSSRQRTLRGRHEEIMSRFAELFSYVCQSVLGKSARSALTLTGRGFQADVTVGGTAMGSLKAIAFDLAALVMSIEGKSNLPALLIHDSPREGDLGESIYHRIFRFMHGLEAVSREPPFQYIVTTTTEPPAELRRRPQLVLELHGSEIDKRLLRRDLH